MKVSFLKYYFSAITSPNKVFKELLNEKRNLLFGLYSLLITATLYTLVYIFLIYGGGQPFRPWLNIPIENYYRYNVFFCAPSMLLGWILSAGVIYLTSRFFSSKGTFDHTVVLLGFGISIASWTTGIHDILTSFLGAIHVINQHNYEQALNSNTIWRTLLWIQMIAYLVWFIVLFSKAAKIIYHIKTGQAILLGTLGFLTYQFFFFIFNR